MAPSDKLFQSAGNKTQVVYDHMGDSYDKGENCYINMLLASSSGKKLKPEESEFSKYIACVDESGDHIVFRVFKFGRLN